MRINIRIQEFTCFTRPSSADLPCRSFSISSFSPTILCATSAPPSAPSPPTDLSACIVKEAYTCQKRPIVVVKEAYFVKRGLLSWQKRPVVVAKEAYSSGKRGL